MLWQNAALLILMTCAAVAELPVLIEKPWTGYFAGREDRDARYKVSDSGRLEIYFLREDEKERRTPDAELRPFLREGEVTRKFKKKQLTSSQKPTTAPETVVFTAAYKGGAEVTVTYTFGKREVWFAAKLKGGDGKSQSLVPGFELKVKSVYSSYFSKKDFSDADWRAKTKGQKMVFEFANGDSLRAKLHEPFAKYSSEEAAGFASGVVKAELKSDALGDGDFEMVLENGVTAVFKPYGDGDRMARNGTFTFVQPSKPITGNWGYLKAD